MDSLTRGGSATSSKMVQTDKSILFVSQGCLALVPTPPRGVLPLSAGMAVAGRFVKWNQVHLQRLIRFSTNAGLCDDRHLQGSAVEVVPLCEEREGELKCHGTRSLPFSLLSLCFADAISATNPRVIDDSRARKLSNDLKRCTYYETCATYGLNVERVFQDGNCSHLGVLGRMGQHCALTGEFVLPLE